MTEMKKAFPRDVIVAHWQHVAALFLSKFGEEMVEVGCPACATGDAVPWCYVNGFSYVKCQTCDLVYQNPQPSDRSLLAYYTAPEFSYSEQNADIQQRDIDLRIAHVMKKRMEFAEQFGVFNSWLDLGCGNALMLAALKQAGIDVHGVEPSEECVRFADERLDVSIVHSDVRTFLESSAGIEEDVVSMFGVLEHLVRPDELLKLVVDRMKDDSLVILLVPAAECLSSFLQKLDPALRARHLCPPAHVTLWGEKSLLVLLDRCGLCAEGIWFYGQDAFELFHHLSGTLDEDEKEKLAALLPSLQQAADELELSDEIMIAARKKASY